MRASPASPDLAKELGLWLNIGSLALKGTGEKLLNRSLLFAPDGTIAARYDKIHLFDVDLPTGESLRESHAYEGGTHGRAGGDGHRPHRPHHLLRHALSPSLPRAGARRGRSSSPFPRPSPCPRARRTGTCCSGRAPSRREASCWPPRRAGRMSRAARPMATPSSSRPGARCWRRPEPSPACVMADIDLAAADQARARIPALAQ